MADHPSNSTKVSCAHCGATFLIQEKNRSKVSCPKCKEPLTAIHSGILKRVGKGARKTSQASIDAIRKAESESKKMSSTFVGAPMGFERELSETSVNLPHSAPKAFKEALAMSRMEMDLSSDAFTDPPPNITGNFDEPTMAIESEVDDKTKPPPGMHINKPIYKDAKKKKGKKESDTTIERPFSEIKKEAEFIVSPDKEPITFPIKVSEIGLKSDRLGQTRGLKDSVTKSVKITGIMKEKVKEEPQGLRRAMKTSELSDLLKKAKKKKRPPAKAKIGTLSLNTSPTKPIVNVPKSIKHFVPSPKEDSLLIQLQELDKKLAPPGMASENRGSGFIKLPTTDILDVLGKGNFRLRVEGIIYEPVDKFGLTQLIKGGVLLGAEDIAHAGGDWMPISEHPVFGELRKRMAAEAHALLSKVTGSVDRQPFNVDEPTPLKAKILEDFKAPSEDEPLLEEGSNPIPTWEPADVERAPEVPGRPVDKVINNNLLAKEPTSQKTMQMFATSREQAPTAKPIIPQESPKPESAKPESADDTLDVFAFESETSGLLENKNAKKKSVLGMFVAIFLILGILIVGVIYANSRGYLDTLTGKTKAQAVQKEKSEKDPMQDAKHTQNKRPAKEKGKPEKPLPKTDDKNTPKSDENIAKIEDQGHLPDAEPKENLVKEEIPSLAEMKFVAKAGGKAAGLIMKKGEERFILIPEREPKELNKLLSAQKLCELLSCPFAQNPITLLNADPVSIKKWDPSYPLKKGKVRVLIQRISKGSFAIANVNQWRSILASTKNAKRGELKLASHSISKQRFARQLSGVLLRDYLVNDWNRFERKPSHLGANEQGLVDQASNVAFGLRASGRVKGRFSWTAIFPSEMVDALRKLKRETTLEFLFPNASAKDKSRFNVFWKQRSSALKRIDKLIASSGKNKVLLEK